MHEPRRAAIGGLALAAPMALLLAAVVLEFDPLTRLLQGILMGDGGQPNAFGRVYMLAGLVLLIPAFIVAVSPMLQGAADRRRHIYPANVAVMVVVGVLIVATWGALIDEVVRCDVLGIPNCD